MKEIVKQRLIIGDWGVGDELDELGVMRFIDDDRVRSFYRWQILFVFLEEAVHVFLVRFNNFLWIVSPINLVHDGIDALDVPEESLVFFAAQQVLAIP